uniref:PR/SET domain 2 n=1 Tax=Tetraodon nigroviridis TaxID=99883 RepID=H3DBC6_TETNG
RRRMAVSGGTVETVAEVPAQVWKGLPDGLSLAPSAVHQSRVGVWATRLIPKGRRFGPFAGEKKKRSQVTSNVYMWEVYFPARGWMCVDATDPTKGNWLRYVNWARSSQEQNLFPLEINRAVYYKVLRPIGPGEELLVWYTVEDNPEITAALEEERASSLSRKNSPGAKRGLGLCKVKENGRKSGGIFGVALQAQVQQITCLPPPPRATLRVSHAAPKPAAARLGQLTLLTQFSNEEVSSNQTASPASPKAVCDAPPPGKRGKELQKACSVGNIDSKTEEDTSAARADRANEEEEDEADDLEEQNEAEQQVVEPSPGPESRQKPPGEEGGLPASRVQPSEPEADPELEPDPDELEGDPHGGSHPCQHCERHFSTRQGLERHVHIHAVAAPQTQLFKCRYCSKAFGSQVGRRRHERRHESGSKKRPGSLGGTAPLLSPATHTDGSSPDCASPASHYIAIGSQLVAGPLHSADMQRKEAAPHGDRAFVFDENGESKELHPCKYCNKAFGTHTNMRRHQRRIHERHLLPKGVRRKGMLLQEASAPPGGSPGTSPPLVYVPSADTEDEADRDDYAIDISKNISENLSFYIDGKIVSTSSASGCEVIEVDARSAALFGLDALIINPAQISQALKAEGRAGAAKQAAGVGHPPAKRRTSTPPLVPTLKVETEPASLTAASSSSASLLRGSYPAGSDSCAFQREKTVYLSPKLKQLLQTQDVQKSTAALTESPRLTSPLAGSAPAGRFKRRTSSPPSSPRLSPQAGKAEAAGSFGLKVPKLESQSASLSPDGEDGDSANPGNNTQGQASANGGSSCNQQPLDLSSSVRRSEASTKVSADSALDLSFQRRSSADAETKAAPAPKKRKPNTSMLEKVLMSEYAGLSLPGDEGPALATPHPFHPPSPRTASDSPLSQPSDSSTLRQLPVLSPKVSPRSGEQKSDTEEGLSAEENKDEGQSNAPPESPGSPLDVSASPVVPEPVFSDAPGTEDGDPTLASHSSPGEKARQNLGSEAGKSLPDVSAESESSPSTPGGGSRDPAQSQASPPQTQVKEEAQPSSVDEWAQDGGLRPSALSENPPEEDGADPTYCKTFVCNVCERPFGAIKDLSGHIAEHAADWPFKCEFCVQLFGDAPALLAHRSTLHGVGRIFVCSACSKEFAFLCNLQQHQKDLHPSESCSHTTVESGKLRPQNYTDPSAAREESSPPSPAPETAEEAGGQEDGGTAKEETDVNGNHTEDPNEELYTTIKIMASEGSKPKGPDVRLGLNQHYPSYKPPPFPYHSRSHAASVASATNFTTHNIPQTFSTAIRCTKCGNSFDNMPELHQHILACANASDKKRYTPKKNPIPLKQIVKSPNGALSPTAAAAAQSAFRRMGQPKRLNFNQEAGKTKMSALSKKKNQLVQKAISQKNKGSTFSKKVPVKVEQEPPSNVCPHCSREFTYPASLSKHMAISCPMKPVVKKGRKKEGGAEKNMTLRRKASDAGEAAPAEADARPLGKTRARSLGAAEPDAALPSRGKAAAGRAKRPASLPAPGAASKKSKKGQETSSPLTPDAPGESAQQRSAARMQRKEAAPKRSAEAKAPAAPAQQPKKEERFSLRTRERGSGPVTRSLQMSGAAPPAEAKSED